MKNILLLLTMMIPLFISCSDDDEQYVSFKQSNLEVDFKGGSFIIDVSANCNWNLGLRANLSWINEKKINESQIELYIQENDTYENREYSITIVSEDNNSSAELKIIQKENKGIIGDNEVGEFDGEKQNITVSIKTNIESPSIDMPEWITMASKGRVLSNKSYLFTLSRNDTGLERDGDIIFSGEGKSWKYTVKQKPIQVLPSKITFKEGENVLLDNNSDFILTPIFFPEDCTDKELEWYSSNEKVITVSDGALKVVGNGDAKVTARSKSTDVIASVDVTVKIKAIQICWGNSILFNNTWPFGEKVKIDYYTIPENAYVNDIVCTSSNKNIVSVIYGYLVSNFSNEGTSQVMVYDPYGGLSSTVDIIVKRCVTYAGSKLITQTVDGLMMSFGGGIRTNRTLEVLSAVLVDENNRALTMANQISSQSDGLVKFYTEQIDMTYLFGITVIQANQLPKLRFLVSYKYNGENHIYQEYVDVKMLNQVN